VSARNSSNGACGRIILGIETSCDDTAAAVLVDGRLCSSVVSSQDAVHGEFGGVVPELASREHLRNILPVIDAALERAEVSLSDVDGVAVTRGPGLVGSLLVGLSTAKGIAVMRGLPLIGVNHLEGHLLSVLLERDVAFPFLALLVSGGHTSLYLAAGIGRYGLVGRSRDDAAGEAFDKAAKLLGLGYPGGRLIDRVARDGDPEAVRFPRARLKQEGYDFSFSGLKTAVRQHMAGGSTVALADIAASVQEALVDMLVERTLAAATALQVERLIVVGGVSANSRLRARFDGETKRSGIEAIFASLPLCTDNAGMIAYAGWRRFTEGGAGVCDRDDGFDLSAQADLPLEPGWRS
jgi:N6-L-threonylcarbamoyladenine synthase